MQKWNALGLVAVLLGAGSLTMYEAQTAPSLDYQFFKARVQPIFLKKRTGHARCASCHTDNNSAFKLEPLAQGAKAWSEEQSRKNFDRVSILVNAGDPATSRLLQQPLAPEAGGNVFHSGGRQFRSKDDADFRTLVQWVNGATLASSRGK